MIAITSHKIEVSGDKNICLFRIANSSGAYVELLNYGATLVSVVVPDKNNNFENVVLSYSNKANYLSDTYYLGSTIGRFANRIRNGNFTLKNNNYQLDKNDGNHSLHGGFTGFNSKILDYEIDRNSITFKGFSAEGEGGFPGDVLFSITYSFSENNELSIIYNASTDKTTPFSLTNHAYFNLSPSLKNCLSHQLKVYADEFLEMDNEFLPTGKIQSTKEPGFNFKVYQQIDKTMALKNETIDGYNTYFLNPCKELTKLSKLATIKEKTSGRKLEVYTTMPGVLFYTGDYLDTPFTPLGGLCLEAQYPPDFLSHPHFKSSIIEPNKPFEEQIVFSFSVDIINR